jgi:hypothetical protein
MEGRLAEDLNEAVETHLAPFHGRHLVEEVLDKLNAVATSGAI